MKWKVDQEEYYFRVYDDDDEIAGYFQPDFGEIQPREKEEQIIQEMLKREDHVYGGLLYVPLLKLNLFNEEQEYDFDHIINSMQECIERTKRWKECVENLSSIVFVKAMKSHTDPDMLSALFGIKFNGPVRLNKEDLLEAIRPVLDSFHGKELL